MVHNIIAFDKIDSIVSELFPIPYPPPSQQTSTTQHSFGDTSLPSGTCISPFASSSYSIQPASSNGNHLEPVAQRQIAYKDHPSNKSCTTAENTNESQRPCAQPREIPQSQPSTPTAGVKRRRSSLRLYDIPDYRPNVRITPAANNDAHLARNTSIPNAGPRAPHLLFEGSHINLDPQLDVLYPFLIEYVIYLPGDGLPHRAAHVRQDHGIIYGAFHDDPHQSLGSMVLHIIQLKLSSTWLDFFQALLEAIDRGGNAVPPVAFNALVPLSLFAIWNGMGTQGGHSIVSQDDYSLRNFLDMIRLRGFQDRLCMSFKLMV